MVLLVGVCRPPLFPKEGVGVGSPDSPLSSGRAVFEGACPVRGSGLTKLLGDDCVGIVNWWPQPHRDLFPARLKETLYNFWQDGHLNVIVILCSRVKSTE